MRYLLTYFEPFHNRADNRSKDFVLLLQKELALLKLDSEIFSPLPVVFKSAAAALIQKIESDEAIDVVIACGEKNGVGLFWEERAQNVNHAEQPDNRGNCPDNEVIDKSATKDLPLSFTLSELTSPFQSSCDAGTFVCNDLSFRVQRWLNGRNKGPRFAFWHVGRDNTAADLQEMVKSVAVLVSQYV